MLRKLSLKSLTSKKKKSKDRSNEKSSYEAWSHSQSAPNLLSNTKTVSSSVSVNKKSNTNKHKKTNSATDYYSSSTVDSRRNTNGNSTQQPKYELDEFKVSVLGAGAVGKSALTIQFIQNLFIDCYDPTIEDSYVKHVNIDNIICKLQIIDTAGQEEFRSLRDTYMRCSDGFVCVYSITDRKTFFELNAFVEQIYRIKDSDQVPMVLVGNKCDKHLERKVNKDEALMFAKQKMHISEDLVFEASAKLRVNVEESFHAAIRQVRKILGTNSGKNGGLGGSGVTNQSNINEFKRTKEKGECSLL